MDTMGIPYIVIEFDGLESQLHAIEVLGQAFGAEEKAERAAAKAEAEAQATEETEATETVEETAEA